MSLISLFALSASALAQTATIDDVMSYQYPGVRSIDGELYYTMGAIQNKTERNLYVLDADLKAQPPILVPLGRTIDLRQGRASGDKRYLWIASDADGMLFQFDASGAETGRRTFETPNHNLNDPDLYPASGSGLLKVAQNKVKKIGKTIEVEAVDSALKTTWLKSFQVEKGGLALLASGANAERIVAVGDGMKGAQEVIALDHAGNELYRTVLDGGDKKLKTTHVAVADDGTVGVFGTFQGTGAVRQTDAPAQYFLAVLDKAGKATVATETWAPEVLTSTSTDPSLTGPPQLVVHDLVHTGKNFRVIGETYVWSGGLAAGGDMPTVQSTPQRFAAVDLLIVDFGGKGEVTAARRIPKPATRTSTLSSVNSSSAESVGGYLGGDYQRLGYRFIEPGGNLVVVSDSYNLLQVACVAPDADSVPLVPRTHLHLYGDKSAGASAESFGVPFKSTGLEYETYDANLGARDTNILMSGKGAFVVADYNAKTVTLRKEQCGSESDDLLEGMASYSTGTVRPFPGGGAYVLYRVESGQNGLDRNLLVLDQGSKVHRVELDLPVASVAQVENAASVLVVRRKDSVHHLAAIGAHGETRMATLDLGDATVTGASYQGAGDTFVTALTFLDGDKHSYTVNWLDQSLAFDATSAPVTGKGRLSVTPVGASSTHAAFKETWTNDKGEQTVRYAVFDRAGKPVGELPGGLTNTTRSVQGGAGGIVVSRYRDDKGTRGWSLDGLNPSQGSTPLDPTTLESKLGMPGLGAALMGSKVGLRFVDAAVEGAVVHLVMELVNLASGDDDGFSSDFLVLDVPTTGKVAISKGTVIATGGSAGPGRYKGLVKGPNGLELNYLELSGDQWVAASVQLADPSKRRAAAAGIPATAEVPAREWKPGAQIKLEKALLELDRGAARLQSLLKTEGPSKIPLPDKEQGFVPLGDGTVRIYRYHPKFHMLEWRTAALN